MPAFSPRHIPALFMTVTLTVGGFLAFFTPSSAMEMFGFPAYIISSSPAQAVMRVYGARCMAIGLSIGTFYWQGSLASVDTVLVCLGATSLLDFWVLWQEGLLGTGIIKGAFAGFLGVWGAAGMTSKSILLKRA